jgi:hypothetical protein
VDGRGLTCSYADRTNRLSSEDLAQALRVVLLSRDFFRCVFNDGCLYRIQSDDARDRSVEETSGFGRSSQETCRCMGTDISDMWCLWFQRQMTGADEVGGGIMGEYSPWNQSVQGIQHEKAYDFSILLNTVARGEFFPAMHCGESTIHVVLGARP